MAGQTVLHTGQRAAIPRLPKAFFSGVETNQRNFATLPAPLVTNERILRVPAFGVSPKRALTATVKQSPQIARCKLGSGSYGTRKSHRLKVAHSNKEVSTEDDRSNGGLHTILQKAATAMVGAALAMALAMGPAIAEEDMENLTITFPSSSDPEVSIVQRTLVEAWGIVQELYVDSSFNNQDWNEQLERSLVETFRVASADEAYVSIRTMLASLGDPFTRIVSPQEYQNFRISNDGALEGVGLLIASEPQTGRLIVLSPIEGGPAARAGVHPGDELVRIDDEDLVGMTGEQAATRLRGRAGTSVVLTLRRAMEGAEESAVAEEFTDVREVQLERETITLSPVYATMLSNLGNEGDDVKTGYIRLSSFSQNAAADMERAVAQLEDEGADSYILDLRNNPGGLVRAGLEVAQIWLDGDETLVNTVDRAGRRQRIALHHSRALTQDPLVVLVNKGSASASEILAGALHDNGRAVLVGDNTYGKGKIQSVFELDDGSALFVTVAKYLSPNFSQIDQVGILPDLQCTAEIPANQKPPPGEVALAPSDDDGADLLKRAIIMEVNPAAQLQADTCVLTAEQLLAQKK